MVSHVFKTLAPSAAPFTFLKLNRPCSVLRAPCSVLRAPCCRAAPVLLLAAHALRVVPCVGDALEGHALKDHGGCGEPAQTASSGRVTQGGADGAPVDPPRLSGAMPWRILKKRVRHPGGQNFCCFGQGPLKKHLLLLGP